MKWFITDNGLVMTTGAVVVGVASPPNFPYLHDLGVAHMANYRDRRMASHIQTSLGGEQVCGTLAIFWVL